MEWIYGIVTFGFLLAAVVLSIIPGFDYPSITIFCWMIAISLWSLGSAILFFKTS